MADTPAPIDPDRILEHSFTAVRRGYDPLEVQRYLLQIANQLRSNRDREAELRHTLDEAEKRTAPIDDLDPSQLTRLLGQETARVLEAAQSAASEIRGKASLARSTIVIPNTSSVQTARPTPGLIRKLPFEASTRWAGCARAAGID